MKTLELFNPERVHSLQDYNTTDFLSSTANVADVGDPAGVLPSLHQFHPGATICQFLSIK